MGLHFGELAKVYGRVQHCLSPFEINPLKGVFSLGRITNTARRFGDNLPYIGPPSLIGYLVYSWTEHEHHRLSRKNPKDFENDQ